ncbi:MAG: glycosyltransferase family 1 protein [Rikenellaceae bacterium]
MKKLLIDVNSSVPYFVTGRVSGIGRTTIDLVNALAACGELPFRVELFSQNMKGIGAKSFNVPFKKKHIYLPKRDVLDKMHLMDVVTRYDLLHIPHNFAYVAHPEKAIVTIHDAMFFSYPEKVFNTDFARKNYTEIAQQCKGIITCSEASKRDIVKYMNVPEDKVDVVYWGYNDELFKPRKHVKNDYCGDAPFFLCVSCNGERKNTISVIRAYSEFFHKNVNHHLIVVWNSPSDDAVNVVANNGLSENVHFVSGVTDEELANLYSSATATFFPSLYEGFGLPILESMASGTPVVTCKNSSLEEVGGDAAIYVDPYDIKAMAEVMRNFDEKKFDLDDMKERVISQANKFSWRKCAMQTIEIYKKYLL